MREFIGKLRVHAEKSGITGMGIEKILVTGYPDEAILQVVETMRTDLVVMGLESENTYTFAPVGDIVAKVVSALKVPALVIPSNFTYKGGISETSRVMYATDFEEADYYSMHRLMNIMAPFNVEIHCVHIGDEDAVAWDKIRMDELQHYIVRGFGKVKVRTTILRAKDVEEGLHHYIDENRIELMAVTTRDRNLFSRIVSPSVTRKVLVHSSVPLFVFHAGRRE
jgi:nucleotide-binding universal stress UspA family protein